MSSERYLVTGAFGCVGAWTVRNLVHEGFPVSAYDSATDPYRLRLIMSEKELSRVTFITGDIADPDAFNRAVVDNGITHIIHLAALQVPFVRAEPLKGARVNVLGTTVVFEAVKRHQNQIKGLAYASSIAVYGATHKYPPGLLRADALPNPPVLYGVFKRTNEETARIYWEENGVHSIGLRPHTVYGLGRDQGLTSAPTKAMLAAAAGRKYHISFGGKLVLQFADDVAKAFIKAVKTTKKSAPVYNLGGSNTNVSSIIHAIEAALPDVKGKITFSGDALPFPGMVDGQPFNNAVGKIDWIPLSNGIKQTIESFCRLVKDNKIDVEKHLM